MNPDTIKKCLRRKPLKPFVIRMPNGEVHEVRHPKCALVMKPEVIVGFADDDRSATYSHLHANGVEVLQAN